MKRGFTLVEMLVVVVVIAILATVAFRLADVGRDVTARSVTVTRLQRIENALSGYYAAFGIYPPVPLQGSRDIYMGVNAHNDVQTGSRGGSDLNDHRVEVACRAQPFGAYFPWSASKSGNVEAWCKMTQELMKAGIVKSTRNRAIVEKGYRDEVRENPGSFSQKGYKWWGGNDGNGNVQLWRHGVMSFLLPCYKFMISQASVFNVGAYAQWTGHNLLPFDPETGILYGQQGTGAVNVEQGWLKLRQDLGVVGGTKRSWKIDNIPSQAACARWIANFEGICAVNYNWSKDEFWNTNIRGGHIYDWSTINVRDPDAMNFYSPKGSTGEDGAISQAYPLDGITVKDGWGKEFFYYSPAPYQSYRIWSSGPNKKTFPPWVDLKSLTSDRDKAIAWMADDIVGMKN